MIYPTQRAVILAGAGVPLTFAMSVIAPSLWAFGAGWIVLIAGFIAFDFIRAAKPSDFELEFKAPPFLYIDDSQSLMMSLNFKGRSRPASLDIKLQSNRYLKSRPEFAQMEAADWPLRARFKLQTLRRGDGQIEALWARWRGPLGLIWLQETRALNAPVPVLPNANYVTDQALRFYTMDAAFGQKIQQRRGDGSEFDSLRDFVTGMDKRAIDWKQSARHRDLKAKEFRTERNHNIVFALDTGRLMCEPLRDVPRLDRALNAALLMSYVCLKEGDKVGFFGFDAAPRVYAKPVSSLSAFPQLLKQTAKIDYSLEETNFTLGLSQLARSLSRRSLIVIFTDFVDTTSAELLIENVGRLIKTHLVVFVSFRDEALETYMRAKPNTPEDVTRAVIAASLAKDREIVLAKLRRMGVQIIEAEIETIGIALLNKFFDLKRRGMI